MIKGFLQLDAIRLPTGLDLAIGSDWLDVSEVRADRFFLGFKAKVFGRPAKDERIEFSVNGASPPSG